jgi:hypothetical protein
MPSEYDPSLPTETAIATSAPVPATTSAELGDGGMKALNAEREQRKALEKQAKQLETMLAETRQSLSQSELSLKEKYETDLANSRQSYQQQVDVAIAERDAKLQTEAEARTVAEQRLQMIENQQLAGRITGEFANTFAPLLNNPNPQRLQSYMKLIEDDLTVDNQGNPALIVRRDDYGRPVELAPIEAAIGYFQNSFPEDFKPPASQKTGGGARNLANPSFQSSDRQDKNVKFDSLAQLNANPKAFLDNMDAIVAGKFQLGDR